jgi:hypothetical protein
MHAAGREVGRELLRQGLISLPEHCVARMLAATRRTRRNLLMLARRQADRIRHQRAA